MNKTFIIAEAGVNHNGDIKIAKKLIDKASEAGVDAVKFQSFKAENIVSKKAEKAEYQKQTSDSGETQFDMLKRLELDVNAHKELIEYCSTKDVIFLSTPFDLDSINLLYNLGLEVFKIPSGEITNKPYLQRIGRLDRKIILSTGMANKEEIQDALKVLIDAGSQKKNITILHANTEYPTPMIDVNLKAMQTIAETFKCPVGYSDHTLGIEIPIAAVALGASVIEKHFTLDRTLKGPDHQASLEPLELKAMVRAIRNIELALGNGIKTASNSEIKNKAIVRKSIVANKEIKEGDLFTENNLTVKRPGTGISPMKWNDVIGEKASQDFNPDDIITL